MRMLAPYASRGVLHSHLLPRFTRITPGARLETMVRWFWVASWNLPDGVTSEQTLLPFAAANLAVEPTGVTLTGPITGAVTHTLTGKGWVVAANLQPAASVALLGSPTAMRDVTQRAAPRSATAAKSSVPIVCKRVLLIDVGSAFRQSLTRVAAVPQRRRALRLSRDVR